MTGFFVCLFILSFTIKVHFLSFLKFFFDTIVSSRLPDRSAHHRCGLTSMGHTARFQRPEAAVAPLLVLGGTELTVTSLEC